MQSFAKEILKKQLIGNIKKIKIEINKNADSGFSVGLVDDNDFFKWTICFTGPEDSLYEVKYFF